MENKVTNLELSKELKELGYKQAGLWWWDFSNNTLVPFGIWGKDLAFYQEAANRGDICAAFTCDELGEALPKTIKTKGEEYNLVIVKNLNELQYESEIDYNTWDTLIKIDADTEANARAKMLIYLIKNKLMKL